MSLKYLVNEDVSLSVTAQIGSTVTPGKVTARAIDVDYVPADNLLLSGKKTLVESVGLDLVRQNWGCTPVPPGSPTWTNNGSLQIDAGATKVIVDGKACMLVGDFAMCACAGSCVQGNTTTPFAGSCKIQISNAGQSKVKGE